MGIRDFEMQYHVLANGDGTVDLKVGGGAIIMEERCILAPRGQGSESDPRGSQGEKIKRRKQDNMGIRRSAMIKDLRRSLARGQQGQWRTATEIHHRSERERGEGERTGRRR
uniref:Uncharacterized protein n=1 Tax=Toxoplasma gondii COUG TaxID=1074873 RepID=A0A2G8Y3B9_TOXGO|nr:hypothetical protein TGCOUG_392980 [Toxoplasma gondii COUG]